MLSLIWSPAFDHFYGEECRQGCCIAWRKGASSIFNMSYKTHSFLVGPLSGQRSIDEMLYRKSLRFDLQSMIEDNHVGFTRDELSYMLNNVCTT